MVCRDADEKAKDPSAKTSGGNVAKMYGAAAGNGVLENRRQPQEEDASVEGSAKRRRAEAAACSVMHVQAPGMQQAEVTGAKKPLRSSKHFHCRPVVDFCRGMFPGSQQHVCTGTTESAGGRHMQTLQAGPGSP